MEKTISKNIDLEKNKEINQRLYFFYKIFCSDLLFYYAISYLFIVNVKGLSTAQLVFADSFYPLFELFFQIPATILVEKIGKKNSLLIANASVAMYIILVLGLSNVFSMIIANIFCALGFVIKNMTESSFLSDSLPDSKNNLVFSKYESKATSAFYFFDAITAFSTGFLYVINPYLPMILSLTAITIAIIINMNFRETQVFEKNKTSDESVLKKIRKNTKDLTQAFKFIFSSSRLKSLIVFNGFFCALVSIMVTLHRSVLNDVNVSSEYFGIILAFMGIIAAVSSSMSVRFHKRYTNRTLAHLGIYLSIAIIFSGLSVVLNLPSFLMYYFLLVSISVVYIVKGPFYTLIKQYLNNFSSDKMILKIYSASLVVQYITSTLVSLTVSFTLNYFTNAFTTMLLGIASFIIMLILIKYMSTRVGLKPEEYSKKDILFTELD